MRVLRGALRWGAALLGLMILYQGLTMEPGTRDLWSVILSKLQQGEIGVGVPGTNSFDFATADLEPGDIILGGNPGCSWGHWTHAALYVGNGQVIDTLLRHGVHLQPVERFGAAYQQAGVLKVNLPREVKEQAVQEALAIYGKPFNLLSGRRSDQWFYCTKVVWYAYHQAGVDLDPRGGYWVVPDRFTESPFVTLTASPPY